MKTASVTTLKRIKWAKYQVEILALAIILDSLTFLWVQQKPECCDANTYFSEATNIKTLGFLPHNGSRWLTDVHNYIYPSFLFLAKTAGLSSRAAITTLQFTLIIGACLLISQRLYKVVDLSFIQLTSITLFASFFPILAFSGYLLTESLASFLLILWVGLWLELVLKEVGHLQRYLLTFGSSLLTGVIWMTRPSFIWVPLVNVCCVVLLELTRHRSWISRAKHSIAHAFFMVVALVMVATPQYLVTRGSRSLLNGVFHLGDWTTSATFESSVFRYVTNLSGCGPVELIFSPYGSTAESLSPQYNGSLIYRFVGFMARWCSGWDAVPSPLTYVYHLSYFPWILLSSLTGLLIVAPFFLVFSKGSENETKNMRYAKIGILLMFIASQIAMGITHGEIRYNVAGWIIAGLSTLLLPQHFREGFPWRKYLFAAACVSLFVVVIGQLTLWLSPFWIACVK